MYIDKVKKVQRLPTKDSFFITTHAVKLTMLMTPKKRTGPFAIISYLPTNVFEVLQNFIKH